MAVYKIFPDADATIYSAYPAKNTGRDSVLEVSVKNTQDELRYLDRSLLTKSPYYSYDLALNDNYTTTANIVPSDDVRRSLIQFSNKDITTIKAFTAESISGSWDARLKLNLAFAQNLSTTYTLEAYAVSQSWAMGTGKYSNLPEIRNGVCWDFTSQYSGSTKWYQEPITWDNYALGNWEGVIAQTILWDDTPNQIGINWDELTATWDGTYFSWLPVPYLRTTGGSWYANLSGSQYFDYMSNKDINMDVTDIVDAWFSGSVPNNGIILKHPQPIEENTGSFVDLKFFSVDTHTIYPPCIEIRWDDSNYYPIGSNYILDNQFTLTLGNNPGTFKQGSIYKFRTSVRDTYPTRQFTTSSVYLKAKYLSRDSYWAVQDLKTNEMIIDFDETYTRLSADSVSNYFTLYMNGLEPERFYRILIKTSIYSTTFGPLSIYNNEQSLYDALSLYSAEELALLPAEDIIIDNNLIFKVIR